MLKTVVNKAVDALNVIIDNNFEKPQFLKIIGNSVMFPSLANDSYLVRKIGYSRILLVGWTYKFR